MINFPLQEKPNFLSKLEVGYGFEYNRHRSPRKDKKDTAHTTAASIYTADLSKPTKGRLRFFSKSMLILLICEIWGKEEGAT